MADNAWSECPPPRSDVWYYGIPGSGAYYWTARFGTYWVGSDWGAYRQQDFERGIGPPVKDWGFISERNAAGQWFQYGVIYFKNGIWYVERVDLGQTAGRLVADIETPAGTQQPEGADSRPPEPTITAAMSHL